MAKPWILIAIAVFVVIFGILAVLAARARKRKNRPIDYFSWFIIGIIWVAAGLIGFDNMPFFFIMGLVFMIIGLVHKKEWKKNHEANKWKNLSKQEKKIRIWILLILGILVLAGLAALLIAG